MGWWLSGPGRKGRIGRCYLMGIELQVYEVKIVVEMDGGEGSTSCMYFIPLNCHLEKWFRVAWVAQSVKHPTILSSCIDFERE